MFNGSCTDTATEKKTKQKKTLLISTANKTKKRDR